MNPLTEAASVLLARGPGSAEVYAVRRAEARALLSQGIPIAQELGDHHAAGEMMELLQSLE